MSSFPSDDVLPIGEIVDGRYRVVQKIGAGGMGSIYEAELTTLHKKVAIKVLPPHLAQHGNLAQRFLREARAASQIEHRNIVQISDFGALDSGAVYYVMEFLKGQDLSQLLAAEGALPWSRARGIFLQLVAALQAAHDKGIIHRDVKPANCFLVEKREVDGSDRVKVLDFGVAKHADGDGAALTGTSEILGTVRYMSPEQANGGKATARSDIYATGVLMYETLAGRVPFDGDNPFQILFKHTKEAPPPLREANPDVPEAVEPIVMKALAKDPDERFESMHALRLAIVSVDKKGRGSKQGGAILTGETIRASAVHYASLPRSGKTVAVPTTGPRSAIDPSMAPSGSGPHSVPPSTSGPHSVPPSTSAPHVVPPSTSAPRSVSGSGPHATSGPHTAGLPPKQRFADVTNAADDDARRLRLAAIVVGIAALVAVIVLAAIALT